jgi:hypothetical protein
MVSNSKSREYNNKSRAAALAYLIRNIEIIIIRLKMFEMFDQQYTRHSRISENLKRIDVQQKYTMDTRYDDWGLGFIN